MLLDVDHRTDVVDLERDCGAKVDLDTDTFEVTVVNVSVISPVLVAPTPVNVRTDTVYPTVYCACIGHLDRQSMDITIYFGDIRESTELSAPQVTVSPQ